MENQRIRISKQMLKEALIDLLGEKSLQKISVHEICSRAQINRTTFYKYYKSQHDLLEDIEQDVFRELGERLASSDLSSDALTNTLSYLEEERKKCLILINSATDDRFSERLFALPQIQVLMEKYVPSNYSEAQMRYIQTFIYNGGYAIVRSWLNSDSREAPAEISQLFFLVINNMITT